MFNDRQRALQWVVFNIWFFSLIVMLLSFLLRRSTALGPMIAPTGDELIKSASLLFGLVLPLLGTIITFYFRQNPNSRNEKIEGVSLEVFWITIMCSALYHIILNLLVIFGVIFSELVATTGRDDLYRQCVFIVNWMGLLSVLLLPAIWLFGGEGQTAGRGDAGAST